MAESFPITMHYGNPGPDQTTELIHLLAGAWMEIAPRGASIMPPGLSHSEQYKILEAVLAAEFKNNWKPDALRWCTDHEGRIAAFACLDPLHGGEIAAGAGEVPITLEQMGLMPYTNLGAGVVGYLGDTQFLTDADQEEA